MGNQQSVRPQNLVGVEELQLLTKSVKLDKLTQKIHGKESIHSIEDFASFTMLERGAAAPLFQKFLAGNDCISVKQVVVCLVLCNSEAAMDKKLQRNINLNFLYILICYSSFPSNFPQSTFHHSS